MSGEPKTHTLEEAIQLLGPDEVLLVGYCGWEGMQYSVVEESSVKFLTHSYSKWEDALTDRLDRKVAARDEAAELRAENKKLHAWIDELALAPEPSDEAAELRARIAELETTNFALSEDSALVANENAELRAALREWAEATRAFEDADSAWDNAIYAGEDTGGYTAAWTRALARMKDAEASLRRLAGGESER